MSADIQHLIDLQAVDLTLAELRGKLQALPERMAAVEKRVADGRQQIAAAKDALTTSLKDRKRYEIDVETWKEKARKYRQQGAEVKTNEAYRALQHEIENAEKEAGLAEDRLLERMVSGEEFERQVKAAEQASAEIELAAKTENEKLGAEQTAVRQDLAAREAERKKLLADVPEDLLDNYERIAARRHGVALAEVRGESCGMCGMLVRPHVVQELRRAESTELFQCETCTRILYYVEHAPEAAPAPPAAADAPPGEA
jgi:predicted  nucleic acid-binding Zn-ribbon protein